MARHTFLILILALVTGCAQVGRLSGGEKDKFAPTPIDDETSPPNRTINYTGNEVSFLFDEFIRLNNPVNNVIMIPPHAKISAEVKGKKLTLKWDEELKPNTTYSIYLKEAVQDITESNDSVIQYVFSTGPIIDSLEFSCVIIDAFTGEAKKKVTVALFDPISNDILYFAETNEKGWAHLKNIKSNDYLILAFNDDNKNLIHDQQEGVAFKNHGIFPLSKNTVDSIPFLYSTPLASPKIRTFNYLKRGRFAIGTTADLIDDSIFINRELIDTCWVKRLKSDSLLLFVPEVKTGSYELILRSKLFVDTFSLRVIEPKVIPAFSITGKDVVSPLDSVIYVVNDKINSVDKTKVGLFNPQDSTEIVDFSISWDKDELFFHFDRSSISKLIVTIDSGAINCVVGTNAKFKSTLELNPSRKYGNITLDISAYGESPILVELMRGKNVIASRSSVDQKTVLFELLDPGEYTVRIVQDANQNSKWDPGDFDNKRQPEVVDYYSKIIQLRANWDITVPLVPAK